MLVVILNFARMLRQTVPPGYFVGRFGGDEFIIIAEGIAEREEIEKLVRNIRKMYEDILRIKAEETQKIKGKKSGE